MSTAAAFERSVARVAMRSSLGPVVTSVAGQAVSSGTNFGVLFLASLALPAEGFLAVSLGSYGALLVSGLVRSLLVDAALAGSDTGHRFASGDVRLAVLVVVAIGAAGLAYLLVVSDSLGSAVTLSGFAYGAAIGPLIAAYESIRAHLFANGKSASNLVLDTAWLVATAGLCLVWFFYSDRTPLGLLLAWSVPAGLIAVVYLVINLERFADPVGTALSARGRAGAMGLPVEAMLDAGASTAVYFGIEVALGPVAAAGLALTRLSTGPASVIALAVPAHAVRDRGTIRRQFVSLVAAGSAAIVLVTAVGHAVLLSVASYASIEALEVLEQVDVLLPMYCLALSFSIAQLIRRLLRPIIGPNLRLLVSRPIAIAGVALLLTAGGVGGWWLIWMISFVAVGWIAVAVFRHDSVTNRNLEEMQ